MAIVKLSVLADNKMSVGYFKTTGTLYLHHSYLLGRNMLSYLCYYSLFTLKFPLNEKIDLRVLTNQRRVLRILTNQRRVHIQSINQSEVNIKSIDQSEESFIAHHAGW